MHGCNTTKGWFLCNRNCRYTAGSTKLPSTAAMLTVLPAVKSLMETLSSCHAGGTTNAGFHIVVTAITLPAVPECNRKLPIPYNFVGSTGSNMASVNRRFLLHCLLDVLVTFDILGKICLNTFVSCLCLFNTDS